MEQLLALLPPRVRVIITSLPTYLAAFITILSVLGDELVSLLPEAVAVRVIAFIAFAIAWLAGVISVIQRLTPAAPSTYGLLRPHEYGRDTPPRFDRGTITITDLLILTAIVCLVVLTIYITRRW